MAGDQPSQHSDKDPDARPATGADLGWTALSYLIGGMAVWGFIGWLVDRWLHTGGVITGIGVVIGCAGGIYLVIQRIGAPPPGPGSS
ncbi:AtpZ/AtpI family protein [Asanoa sp. WMMD1127]|uniref:AtpZ/AtpI family protein n=1 Tax=Asanoa sp. WMMD1127 TaxID=3016107 RepID=UPI002417B1FE|nr:AtpZ/AtpI family protein [Asanoa sp. WMMD1127]MDG4823316.1 AtpZ/AtpI family protein [Asanoa sp. WMMD1127]